MGDSTNKQNNETITVYLTKKTIALIILGISALLAFIGVFGTILGLNATSGSYSEYQDAVNLEFLFKKGWDTIRDLSDRGANSALLGFYKFQMIIMLLSFIVAACGITITILYSLYKIFGKKEELNFKRSLSIISISSLQYVALVNIVNATYFRSSGTTPSFTANTVFGWGSILIIVAFFIGLIALIFDAMNNKNSFFSQSNIFSKIGIILIFFISIFGLAKLASFVITSPGTTGKETFAISSYGFLSELLTMEGAEIKNYGAMKGFSIASIVFGLISLIVLMYTLYLYINSESKNIRKHVITFSSLYLIFIILSGIFQKIAIDKMIESATSETMNYTSSLGASAIVGIILGSILLLDSIFVVCIKDKNIKFFKN